MNITVAGVGYVGLAQAVLLAQHNAVTAVTTTPAKAENINRGVSPIVDAEITDFLRTKPLTLTATVDAEQACERSHDRQPRHPVGAGCPHEQHAERH